MYNSVDGGSNCILLFCQSSQKAEVPCQTLFVLARERGIISDLQYMGQKKSLKKFGNFAVLPFLHLVVKNSLIRLFVEDFLSVLE